jgi:hypothetical protein
MDESAAVDTVAGDIARRIVWHAWTTVNGTFGVRT